MECDLNIFEAKMKDITRSILTKECTIEDVLTDIKECGFGLKQSWEALENACRNLKCSKLKGRVGIRDSICYVEVMLLSDVANLILDVMTTSLAGASEDMISNFFTSKIPDVIPVDGENEEKLVQDLKTVQPSIVKDVNIYIDPMTNSKMHLILPKEDSAFEGSEIGVSLGPLVLDLRQKFWCIDLTLFGTPKEFLFPSRTKSILVRFSEN